MGNRSTCNVQTFYMKQQDKAIYWPEYYTWIGEHGELKIDERIYDRTFDQSVRYARNFLKAEKKDIEQYGYIGVEGTGNKFAIVYITRDYIDNTDEKHFKSKGYYESWLKIAKKALDAGKLYKGVYDECVLEYKDGSPVTEYYIRNAIDHYYISGIEAGLKGTLSPNTTIHHIGKINQFKTKKAATRGLEKMLRNMYKEYPSYNKEI